MTHHKHGSIRANSSQPAASDIEDLPWLGTTWYERGRAYWWRRAGVSLVLLLSVLVLLPFVYWALSAMYMASPALAAAAIAVMASTAAATAVWMWRNDRVQRVGRRTVRRTAAVAGATGLYARAGFGLAGAVLVVGALLTLGPFLVLFVVSLFPQLPPERLARQRLERFREFQ